MTRKRSGASVGQSETVVTEAMLLELLQENRGHQYKRGHVANRLNCSTAEIRPHLDALVEKGLIRTTVIGPNRVFFVPLISTTTRPERIVGKGELSGDYNGVRRHMQLCMEVRR